MDLAELRKLVRQGEGENLEFKRKATHPDKIAREIIAFANTTGGILLVGVDDDKSIYGCKYADEEAFAIQSFLDNHCRWLQYFARKILLSVKWFVRGNSLAVRGM